ncbi:MAG TPA: preprotein translocase subunit SecA [Candidatus Bipolaricaulota bacterium]|nr:preprotein translocase subunit SecA [Candidatus Bipolaricaulota bacterium]
MSIFTKILGDPNKKVIDELMPIVDAVNSFGDALSVLTDDELKNKTSYFKALLASGKTLDDILPEAFATVKETAWRSLSLRHFNSQVIGGMVLHQGKIAEMKTGEGKTLAATLPVYLNALVGKGVHVITVNDYLAKRDTVWMGQVYDFLGLSVGCVQHDSAFLYDENFSGEKEADEQRDAKGAYKVQEKFLRPVSRKDAYAADIVYGTNNEFGFDYLRDNMVSDIKQKVQRELNYAIIDEVDSILIDEARTPLIISAPAEESADLYNKFAKLVPKLIENQDYNIDEKMRAATLTEEGIEKIEKMLGLGNVWTEGGIRMVHHLEEALKAMALFKNDRDYVIKDGEIVIIDEFTGRLMEGRRYSEGLHQAIEAKEGVEVRKESRTLATITFQNYFRMYEKLSGMTGTAETEAEEFGKIYKLDVLSIPTNKKMIRQDDPDRIFATEAGKFKAIVNEAKMLHEKGQPVLIGTISIEKNEILSGLLAAAGVPHQVLNAKNHEKEASIIAQAGKSGGVTVATNMAGRGVDIILGGVPFDKEEYEKVKNSGGLFVLGTERHESRRIDNQLRGRAGRQGDPGASQFYVSAEDDLMRVFGSERVKSILQTLKVPEDMPIENKFISRALEKAQVRVEGYHFDTRKHLVEYDDVMNKQRDFIYRKRNYILGESVESPEKVREIVIEMIDGEIEQLVSFHTAGEAQSAWDIKEIAETAKTMFPTTPDLFEQLSALEKTAGDRENDAMARTAIIEFLQKSAKKQYDALIERINEAGKDVEISMPVIEKEILVRSIDNLWVDHLDALDGLRTGIGLRGYGQRDPLIEYKKESRSMFEQLQNMIGQQVARSIFKVGLIKPETPGVMQSPNVSLSAPSKVAGSSNSTFSADKMNDPYKTARRQLSNPVKQKTRDASGNKVGRNDPCPCGSGKKFKKCCGG